MKNAIQEGDGPEEGVNEKLLKKSSPKTHKSCTESMGPIVLMIGLGIHSIFEGLALGMSENFEGTLLFAIAICLHKGAAGISLGISLTKTFPK